MRFREHYFKRESTVADSDTVIIDINVTDPISYITVEYEARNGITSCKDHALHHDVSRIELVDGSEVLWSLNMEQAIALNVAELGVMPHNYLTEKGSEVQEESCIIHFGRYPDDPDYYFDPSRYKNPQLRLVHELKIANDGGFTTGTGKVTVKARIIEEGAHAYAGYLMSKEKYSWTSTGSGDETVDLPQDYPYRKLLIQAKADGITPEEILTKIKLSCDADKYVPFDAYTEDIADLNLRTVGLVNNVKRVKLADGEYKYFELYSIKHASIFAEGAHIEASPFDIDANQITVNAYNFTNLASPTYQTEPVNMLAKVVGLAPFGIYQIPFGNQDDETTWFPASLFSDIKLTATQGGGGDCAIILQQLR